MRFAERSAWGTEPNLLSQTLTKLQQEEAPILDLTLSNPTQASFSYLNSTLLEAFDQSENLLYEPNPYGLLRTREAVCRYYERKGLSLSGDQIFLTASTSEAYAFIFRILFDPQDSLLVLRPTYPILDYLASIHDVTLQSCPLVYKDGWKIDFKALERSVDKKTKALLLVHPNNPTGHYVREPEKKAVLEFCRSHSLALIVDEVFYDYDWGRGSEKPESFSKTNEVPTFVVSGISKVLGLPQMKLSWTVINGPKDIVKESVRRFEVIADTFLSVSTPIQNALPIWFECMEKIQKEIRARILRNRSFLEAELTNRKKCRLLQAEGGWYSVLELAPPLKDEALAVLLLREDFVLTHPGYLFDFPEDSFLILSLLPRPEIFEEGIKRLLARRYGFRVVEREF